MRPFCSVKRPLQNGIVAAGGRKMQILFCDFLITITLILPITYFYS